MTVDYPKAFYVADRNNHRIQKFFTGSTNGSTVAGFGNGTYGTIANGLREPSKIILDRNENIYVCDTSNHQVKLFMKNNLTGTSLSGRLKQRLDFSPIEYFYSWLRFSS